jgi:hypothetical protein
MGIPWIPIFVEIGFLGETLQTKGKAKDSREQLSFSELWLKSYELKNMAEYRG